MAGLTKREALDVIQGLDGPAADRGRLISELRCLAADAAYRLDLGTAAAAAWSLVNIYRSSGCPGREEN